MTETTAAPYEQWTVEELREELRSRELAVSGSKPELVARLTASDRDAAEADTDAGEPAEPSPETTAELATAEPAEPEQVAARGECVVDDGTPHMGRATPGAKICSAHAMHYLADGTPRAGYGKAATT